MTIRDANGLVWQTAIRLGVLVLAVTVMWGCSSAKGQKLPERLDVLNAMKTMGFQFDATLLSTEYGSGPSQVVVTGPIAGPPRPLSGVAQNKALICPYAKAVLNKSNDKWVLEKVEKRSVGWWASQSSCEICNQ